MKKIIYALIIPLLFVTRVNAEGLYSLNHWYDVIEQEKYVIENYSSYIQDALDYFSTNYNGEYLSYVVRLHKNGNVDPYLSYSVFIVPTTSTQFYHGYSTISDERWENVTFDYFRGTSAGGYSYLHACTFTYYRQSGYVTPELICDNPNVNFNISDPSYMPIITGTDFTYYNENYEATLEVPSYTDSNFNFPSYTIGVGNNLPTYDNLSNNDYIVNPNASFVNINLKNYDYVVLSLRNYNVTSLNTPIYTLGSLCITRVNNYGMTEISSSIPSYKTPSCSDYYTSSTPVNLYVDSNMLSSKPVWYIKSPSDERPNSISVNSDIFNISYIDSSNRDNPTVVIGGRDYPIIPYDNLTDTAIISTNEGYISGEVCSPFDNNCILNQNNIDSFDDIFSHPIQTLESVWTSIVSVFGVISAFLMLLPTPLQTFLYLSFMLGVILGLIKILI